MAPAKEVSPLIPGRRGKCVAKSPARSDLCHGASAGSSPPTFRAVEFNEITDTIASSAGNAPTSANAWTAISAGYRER